MGSYVEKILEHFLKVEEDKEENGYCALSWQDKDDFRLSNDNDAKYYYEECHLEKDEALKADTIISFWTPYCHLLRIEANWDIYYNAKTTKTLNTLLNQIKVKHNRKINKINERIEEFAMYYYTKGNYMLLPERGMNTKRYKITEDRIDLTLYECFAKGRLSSFFVNEQGLFSEQALFSWIKRERLECVFRNNTISKNNIIWFGDERKMISNMESAEIYEYLKNATTLIKTRNR